MRIKTLNNFNHIICSISLLTFSLFTFDTSDKVAIIWLIIHTFKPYNSNQISIKKTISDTGLYYGLKPYILRDKKCVKCNKINNVLFLTIKILCSSRNESSNTWTWTGYSIQANSSIWHLTVSWKWTLGFLLFSFKTPLQK